MIRKDVYRVIEYVDISTSLYSQSRDIEFKQGITKALISSEKSQDIVCYFLEPVNFGIGTTIKLEKDIEIPFLYRPIFKIVSATPFSRDPSFSRMLLSRKT